MTNQQQPFGGDGPAGSARTGASLAATGPTSTITLEDLAAVLSAATAEQFFAAATDYLTRTLGVAFAFVGAVAPDRRSATTLHLIVDGKAADNIRYDLDQTPCESVLQTGFCTYEKNVQQLFPEDKLLPALGIESYCGMALHSPEGEVLGLLVVMDRQPLADRGRTETLVRVFAGRTSSALVRLLHEQQLRESRRVHETLLGNLPGMVYRCQNDADWTSIFASQGSLALTGYPPEHFVSHRVNFGQLIHPDDRRMVWDKAQAAIRDKIPFRIKYRIHAADGREKWVSEFGQGVYENGRLAALEGFITDITAQRLAEETLARHNRLLETVSAIDAMIVRETDRQQLLEETCRILTEVGGYRSAWIGLCERPEPVIRPVASSDNFREYVGNLDIRYDDTPQGRGPAGLAVRTNKPRSVPDVSVEASFAPWASLALAAGYRSLLCLPLRQEAQRVIGVMAIHAAPAYAFGEEEIALLGRMADNVGHALAALEEIQIRIRAEEALQQSEANFRALTENANVGILVNHQGRHVLANPRLCRLLGYTPEEITRTGIRDLVHPDELDVVMQRFRDRQQGRPVPSTYETVFVTKTGQPVPVEITATLTLWQGVPSGLVFVHDMRERKLAEQALVESEQRYRALMQEAADGIFIADSVGNYVNVNPRACAMVGYREDELLRMNMKDLIPPGDPPPQLALLRSVRSMMLERRLRHQDGHLLDVEISASRLEDGRLQSIVRDITERKRAEAEMKKLSSAVEQTADSVLITDVNGIIEYVNPAFEQATGYAAAEAIGQTPRLVKSGQHDQDFYKKLWATILAGEVFRAVIANRRRDGTVYYEEKTITPIRDENRRITHFVSTGKDITERMQSQQRLQFLAYHDVLTGLPNRTLFLDRLEHALQRAPRGPRSVAVLGLDVDRFKIINDTLGHDVGDRLLRTLAERLKSCVREADTVARLSGDEFAILLEDLGTTDDVVRVARKILQAFSSPFNLGERELFVTTSIGVSIYPEDGKNANDLLKSADTAMYRAKEAGRNTYQFYSPDMSARAVERLALETGLRRALERRELVLYYQPLVDLRTRRVVSVEALLRWNQPQLGLVQPNEFIPLLEETGMIVPVGEWVITAVADQLERWRAARRDLRVSINLSARQFIGRGFADQVMTLVEEKRLDPTRLELEITESILMQNAQDTLDLLTRLDSLGCRLAIDDFGTGYSSLSYLKRFPIDVLKIDRSFVRDVPDDKDDASIVTTIVAMAHNLKLQVVAEGVETEKQLAFLRACGCDLMQGSLYSRPLPLEELERLLDQETPLRG
jgi:diguanylate cyclase (GGDEF)-like protein/PAS domain S-box-containing protein